MIVLVTVISCCMICSFHLCQSFMIERSMSLYSASRSKTRNVIVDDRVTTVGIGSSVATTMASVRGRSSLAMSILSTPHVHHSHHHVGNDIAKMITNVLRAHPAANLASMKLSSALPLFVQSVIMSIYPADLFLFIFFQLTHKNFLQWSHKLQIIAWKLLHMGTPMEWNKSILGFLQERAGLLTRLMGCNYVIKLMCMVLVKLGFRIRSDFPVLLSRVSYALYIANFVDLFKSKFLHTFFPSLADNRRQSYVVKRSTSFIIWTIGVLVSCEMVSTYMKVPLTSTLALGGVGGLAIGLSARDIAANFLGGLLLLFNEPFVPGDMVTFRTGNTECIGRVERVGWGQTRIRGRDTRPTYIPNSHFVQTAVTNMERITHRKFEAIIPLRFQDYNVMNDVLAKIKESLRTIPKLDVLSMPFRVSFIKFGNYSLEIEVTCYFATKSIDEFLALQQMANLEILRAVRECGAQLALPTTQYIQANFAETITATQGQIGMFTTPVSAPTASSLPTPVAATAAAVSTLSLQQQPKPPSPKPAAVTTATAAPSPVGKDAIKTVKADIPVSTASVAPTSIQQATVTPTNVGSTLYPPLAPSSQSNKLPTVSTTTATAAVIANIRPSSKSTVADSIKKTEVKDAVPVASAAPSTITTGTDVWVTSSKSTTNVPITTSSSSATSSTGVSSGNSMKDSNQMMGSGGIKRTIKPPKGDEAWSEDTVRDKDISFGEW